MWPCGVPIALLWGACFLDRASNGRTVERQRSDPALALGVATRRRADLAYPYARLQRAHDNNGILRLLLDRIWRVATVPQ
jgi:hypothetical protein